MQLTAIVIFILVSRIFAFETIYIEFTIIGAILYFLGFTLYLLIIRAFSKLARESTSDELIHSTSFTIVVHFIPYLGIIWALRSMKELYYHSCNEEKQKILNASKQTPIVLTLWFFTNLLRILIFICPLELVNVIFFKRLYSNYEELYESE